MILVAKAILRFSIFLLFPFIFFYSCDKPSIEEYTINGETMGTTYRIVINSKDSIDINLKSQIDSILLDFNQSMSTYIDDSQISIFNKMNKGEYLSISDDFYHVLEKSLMYYNASKGLFDITIDPIYKIWGFRGSNYISEPTQIQIDSVLSFVGMNHIEISNSSVSKSHSKARINLGAIAKGYAVDIISNHLISNNHLEHLVEIGGEIKVHTNRDYTWSVGIQNPKKLYNVIEKINIKNNSIATSGNYFNYREYLDSKSIKTHIINPITGYPLEVIDGRISSATVISKDCIDADAIATILMLLDKDKALDFIENTDQTEAYIIFFEKDSLNFIESSGFNQYKN